jgi:hypothetical protein
VDTASLRREAESLFLGRDHVIGVGLAGDTELVFLLDSFFPAAEEKIERWAREKRIGFAIRVTPAMRLA